MVATLMPPTFAGQSVVASTEAFHDDDGFDIPLVRDIGSQDDIANGDPLVTRAQDEMDHAFERAMSEIDETATSAASITQSPTTPLPRFGDIATVISAQPLAGEMREAVTNVKSAVSGMVKAMPSMPPGVRMTKEQ